jgi:hypothetical protein
LIRELQGYLDPELTQHKLDEDLGDLKEKLKEINAKVLEHLVEIEEKIA